MKKEDINEIIKQSSEKKPQKYFIQLNQNNQTIMPIITTDLNNNNNSNNTNNNNLLQSNFNNNFMQNGSTLLTPMSGFSTGSLENIINTFDQAQMAHQLQSPGGTTAFGSTIQRPNNLKISASNSSLLTPSPVAAYALMQGLMNYAANKASQSNGNNNINNNQQQQNDFQNMSNNNPFLNLNNSLNNNSMSINNNKV